MLKLLQSLFGAAPAASGGHPEKVVARAIERAVDGTDPRLRALPGYQKRVRGPVLRALDHVVALVDALPPPVELSRAGHAAEPRLRVMFANTGRITELLGERRVADACRAARTGSDGGIIHASLSTQFEEQMQLGLGLQGDQVRRDVAHQVASFTAHRLLDPAADAQEARNLLMRRGFDHLLSLALTRIVAMRQQRAGLEEQRALLKQRLRLFEQGDWGFEPPRDGAPGVAATETELATIEKQLAANPAPTEVLQNGFDIVCEVLDQAAEQLTLTPVPLTVDAMNIICAADAPGALSVTLDLITSVSGRRSIVLPVTIPVTELPKPRGTLAEAVRRLG